MQGIYEELADLSRANRPCALATIVQATGSTPQRAGAKMLVRKDGSIAGTLGGGCIEAKVIGLALTAMEDGAPRTEPFDLTETESGLVCGGNIVVFIEPLLPDPHLVIIGAGHVGRALATIAKAAGFRITVTDDREEYANSRNIPAADAILVNSYSNPLQGIGLDSCSYVVIATRGHTHDLDALRAVLRTDAGYVGLVGSRRKKAVLFGTLMDEGFSRGDVERIVIPVGLPIGSVTPGEIAISIVAQLIQTRRNHGEGICHSACGGIVDEDGTIEAAPAGRG